MTLHGLWPSLKSGSMLPDCNSGKDVPISIADKALLTTMQADWPSYTGPDDKFWTHEYNKHGFCYTNKSKTEGFIPYFSLGMEIFKKHNLENFISDLVDGSKDAEIAIKTGDLKALIAKKFPEIKFDLDCKKSGTKSFLAEIRIYLNLDFKSFVPPKGRSDCPASQPIYIGKFIQ